MGPTPVNKRELHTQRRHVLPARLQASSAPAQQSEGVRGVGSRTMARVPIRLSP